MLCKKSICQIVTSDIFLASGINQTLVLQDKCFRNTLWVYTSLASCM